ncbi:hypothetical protein ACFFWC_24660 [Plantactinospora siamensis]|uniref:Uncharacterized protein n=1 Tax=Plantactinospora siamensis TaxID=555372 RepID=A0ABV6P6G7_9ACTN
MTTPREQLLRLADDYRRKAAAIRADDTLSTKGKRQQLAQLYEDTEPRRAELATQMQRHDYTSRSDLQRRLFGLPAGATASDAISFRDAQDRVAGIRDPHQLADLMERAHTTGDQMLLRAGFAHAYQQSRNPLASDMFVHLVNEYADQHPAAQLDLQELEGKAISRNQDLADRALMAVPKPRELDVPEPVDTPADAA